MPPPPPPTRLDYLGSRGRIPRKHRPYRHGRWDLPDTTRQLIFACVGGACLVAVIFLVCVIVISFGNETAVPPGLRAVWRVLGRWF